MSIQALSPALLLYRIAHNMQYTPPVLIGKCSMSVQQSKSQRLHDTEKQLIKMNKANKSRGSDNDVDSFIGSLPETLIRYVSMNRHESVMHLMAILQPSTTIEGD
jgi:hypothetical protein